MAGEGPARHARGEAGRHGDRLRIGLEPALQRLPFLGHLAASGAVQEVRAQRGGLGLGELAVEIARHERAGVVTGDLHVWLHGVKRSWCSLGQSGVANSGCKRSIASLKRARARKRRDSTVPIEMPSTSAISW